MFCVSSLPTHFATLVCGMASESGEIKICNAGHHPALLVRESGIELVESTGLPIGMFCDERYSLTTVRLDSGESLVLYTDGLLEAENESGLEYGTQRVQEIVLLNRRLDPEHLVSACLEDLESFRAGTSRMDDLTIMAIRKI